MHVHFFIHILFIICLLHLPPWVKSVWWVVEDDQKSTKSAAIVHDKCSLDHTGRVKSIRLGRFNMRVAFFLAREGERVVGRD